MEINGFECLARLVVIKSGSHIRMDSVVIANGYRSLAFSYWVVNESVIAREL